MGNIYDNGIILATGFKLDDPRPLDDKDIVATFNDLLTLEHAYEGITVKVQDEDYAAYTWVTGDQSTAANWHLSAGGGGSDSTAIHIDVADEFIAASVKATVEATDLLLIEDTGDSGNKKYIQVRNLNILQSSIVENITTSGSTVNHDISGGGRRINVSSSVDSLTLSVSSSVNPDDITFSSVLINNQRTVNIAVIITGVDEFEGNLASPLTVIPGYTRLEFVNYGGLILATLSSPNLGDAETLNGLTSDQFLRSDTNDVTDATVRIGLRGYISGSETSDAALQINGFVRTGDIYLHTGGNTPNSTRSNDYLSNNNGALTWRGSNVWTAINQGSGSGLDADLLDGIHASQFIRSDIDDTAVGLITISRPDDIQLSLGNDVIGYSPTIQLYENTDLRGIIQYRIADDVLRLRNEEAGSHVNIGAGVDGLIYNDGTGDYKIFHEGNSGSGSGIDADTLNGLTSSQFIRSDISDSTSGQLTISYSVDEQLRLGQGQSAINPLLGFYEGTTRRAALQYNIGSNITILTNDETSTRISLGTGQNGFLYRYGGADYVIIHTGNLSVNNVAMTNAANTFTQLQTLSANADEQLRLGYNITANPEVTFYNGTNRRAALWWDETNTSFVLDNEFRNRIFTVGDDLSFFDGTTDQTVYHTGNFNLTGFARTDVINTFTLYQMIGGYLSVNKTTVPAYALDVVGTIFASAQIRTDGELFTGTSANAGYVNFLRAGANYLRCSASGSSLYFQVNGSVTRMMIDSSGNVGIGTTSPSYALHVVGTGHFTGHLTAPANISVGSSTAGGYVTFLRDGANYLYCSATNGALYFQTGGANTRMIISAAGNVGIGTTSPSYAFHNTGISFSGVFRTDTVNIRSSSGLGIIENLGTDNLLIYGGSASASRSLLLGSANTTDVRTGCYTTINSNGAPSYPLHVNGTGYFSGNLYAAGSVGIGTTSPSYKLHVVGEAYIQGNSLRVGTSGVSYIYMLRDGLNYLTALDAAGSLVFQTGGSNNRMIINAAGNVGIGTTSPSYPLQVNGNGYFSGNLYAAGNVGIGTTSPTEKLYTSGAIGSSGRIYSTGNSQNNISNIAGIAFWYDTSSEYGIIACRDWTTSTGKNLNIDVNNLGVGIASPNWKLHVIGSGYFVDGALILAGESNAIATGQSNPAICRYSGGHMGLVTGSYDRLHIRATGLVGIGTTSPSYMLDVAGDCRIQGDLIANIGGASGHLTIADISGTTINKQTGSFTINSVSNQSAGSYTISHNAGAILYVVGSCAENQRNLVIQTGNTGSFTVTISDLSGTPTNSRFTLFMSY